MAETTGKIIRGIGGLFFVDTQGGVIPCRARGRFRHDRNFLQVGDNVSVGIGEQGENTIETVLPRKNSLIRPPLANLDLIFVVIPSAAPAPDLPTVDKLTAIAVHNRISPAIVISKCGIDAQSAEHIRSIYSKSAIPVFVTDAVNGTGLDRLKSFIAAQPCGSISAFAGASGAGKSTLLNTLFPELTLETGTVSEKTERGRHTTRKVELFRIGGGYIADTPGFTMLDFRRFDFFTKDDLPGAFPEFLPYIGKCRYRKCTHTKEDGCAILEAVSGGRIAAERHRSYLDLFETLKDKHDWDKKR